MLVSAIMPTRGRQQYAAEALNCFLQQTYQDKELMIVDDADDPSFPDGVSIPGVVYHRLSTRLTVGAKRNLACSRASGEVICHADSDDWSAPERIEDQLTLMEDRRVVMVGYSKMKFLDVDSGEWWEYSNHSKYSLGTALMYKREWWRANPFLDISEGEDNNFVGRASSIATADAGNMMFARIHDGNTSDKRKDLKEGSSWRKLIDFSGFSAKI